MDPNHLANQTIVRKPWWWILNPWGALANRERIYEDALQIIEEEGMKIRQLQKEMVALRKAVATVDVVKPELGEQNGSAF